MRSLSSKRTYTRTIYPSPGLATGHWAAPHRAGKSGGDEAGTKRRPLAACTSALLSHQGGERLPVRLQQVPEEAAPAQLEDTKFDSPAPVFQIRLR